MKGVPGTWALFRLTEVDHEPVAPPLGDEEADALVGRPPSPSRWSSVGPSWSGQGGEVISVDPARDDVGKHVSVGGAPKALAATEDHLWAVDPADSNLIVVDLDTQTLRKSIDVGGEPVDVAAGLEAVWVADLEGRLVKGG